MKQKTFFSLFCALVLGTSLSAQDRDVIAGIPVNYDESKVGDYHEGLPDPLVFNDGKPVKSAKQWAKRRSEIIQIFEENQFGKWPDVERKLRYSVRKDTGLGGIADREQVSIYFSPDDDGPRVDVLVYLPKDAKGPSPVLLNLSFSSNNMVVGDPGVKSGRAWDRNSKTMREIPSSKEGNPWGMDEQIKAFIEAGFGFATLCYTDIEPDFIGGETLAVRGLYPDNLGKPDSWGAIATWAWGVSHVVDYFEKDPKIDSKRIALTGCSRLGKTTMWTGAKETRIAVVIASCSGEGGAALSRRNFGETVAHLTEQTRFPYQFAPNYGKWGDKVHEMPMDANLLVSLIAPRPLLLQTGTTDNWSDPKGEFYAALEAGKVYRLLGKDDLGTEEMPKADSPIYHTLGYVMHEGGHGVMPQDWGYYLEFIKKYL